MSDPILELVSDVLGVVVEAFATSDTFACRIFWGIVIVGAGGVIWWELHSGEADKAVAESPAE